jgi:hypothetical protein
MTASAERRTLRNSCVPGRAPSVFGRGAIGPEVGLDNQRRSFTMPYPDDFNQAAFDRYMSSPPEEVLPDFDFIENKADAILDEMVQAVRYVVAKHSLSFFHESEDVLRELCYQEFVETRVRVSQDAIIEAGFEAPWPKHVTVAPLQGEQTNGGEPEEGSMK